MIQFSDFGKLLSTDGYFANLILVNQEDYCVFEDSDFINKE